MYFRGAAELHRFDKQFTQRARECFAIALNICRLIKILAGKLHQIQVVLPLWPDIRGQYAANALGQLR
jgi:hypothetical protein